MCSLHICQPKTPLCLRLLVSCILYICGNLWKHFQKFPALGTLFCGCISLNETVFHGADLKALKFVYSYLSLTRSSIRNVVNTCTAEHQTNLLNQISEKCTTLWKSMERGELLKTTGITEKTIVCVKEYWKARFFVFNGRKAHLKVGHKYDHKESFCNHC